MLGKTLLIASVAAAALPTEIHLAYAEETNMGVSFSLGNSSIPVTCTFGIAGGPQTGMAQTIVRSYLGGSFHHAVMGPLAAATRYTYSCAGEASAVHGFTSPPAAGDLTWGSFAAFGDWGYLGSAERGPSIPIGGLFSNWSAVPVRELVESWLVGGNMSFVLHTGDINYADDSFGEHPFEFNYEKVANGWFNWIQNISASMPYMVSVGNHESSCHSPACFLDSTLGEGERNFTAYNTRWSMPSGPSGGVMNMWYSWNVGGVHFVALNTETDFVGAGEENTSDEHFFPAGHFAPDGDYLKWLAADLAVAAADPTIAFIVAHGHRPFEDLPDDHSETLLSLFKAAQVDLYLAGHGHSYTRYDSAAWGDGVVHIMAGGAGCDEMGWPEPTAATATADSTPLTPSEACATWCTSFEAAHQVNARRASAKYNIGDTEPERACHFCKANGADPVAVSNKYAAGLVAVSQEALTFTLHNAPDGTIIDTIIILRKTRHRETHRDTTTTAI